MELTPQFELSEDAMLYAARRDRLSAGRPERRRWRACRRRSIRSELTSYEIGMKSGIADDRLLLDLAVFYIDWEDIQIVIDRQRRDVWLINGGAAASQGIELSMMFDRPTA